LRETVPQIFVIITFTTQKCEMTQNHFGLQAKMGQEGTINFAKTMIANIATGLVTLKKPQITCSLILLGYRVLVSHSAKTVHFCREACQDSD
jgi:hypothetical protein